MGGRGGGKCGACRLIYLSTVNTRAIFPIARTLFLITSLLAAIAAAVIEMVIMTITTAQQERSEVTDRFEVRL